MVRWTSEELDWIGGTDEIQLAPRRRDGSLRKPLTVWIVRAGDDLYVRSWRGRSSSWFRAAQASHAGRIRAGDIEREVIFAPEPDPGINDRIDDAYRAKYGRSSYLSPMISADARATTLKLVPRDSRSQSSLG